MEFGKRNGLLRRLISIVLIAALVVSCLPARPAEAFIEEIIAAIVIAACEAALHLMMPKLKDAAGDSLGSAGSTFLHEAMLLVEMGLRFALEIRLYDLDHEALSDNAVEGNLTPFLSDFYGKGLLSDAGFDAANPGYRNVSPGAGAVIFSGVYADRMSRLLTQGKAKLEASRSMGMSITDAGNPAGVDTIQSVHEALMGAGEYLEKGYREMLQAESQAHTMANKQASVLRATETMRNDAVIRYAQNERQEKADKAAAFEQAVRQWNIPVTSGGY